MITIVMPKWLAVFLIVWLAIEAIDNTHELVARYQQGELFEDHDTEGGE